MTIRIHLFPQNAKLSIRGRFCFYSLNYFLQFDSAIIVDIGQGVTGIWGISLLTVFPLFLRKYALTSSGSGFVNKTA